MGKRKEIFINTVKCNTYSCKHNKNGKCICKNILIDKTCKSYIEDEESKYFKEYFNQIREEMNK